jgi:hypothetical protein
MPLADDLALSRLLGNLYTEVFQRKQSNPNRPLNRSSHQPEIQTVTDDLKGRLVLNTNTFVWGPGGGSDETDNTPSSARWIGTAVWG